MTPQTFSLEMCRLLSSLAPGFEGHWRWYRHVQNESKIVACLADNENTDGVYVEICPAWQAEDMLMNFDLIYEATKKHQPYRFMTVAITEFLTDKAEFAYQKIEEYLLSIIK